MESENKGLENFAYRTSVSSWIFALAGLLILDIPLLTVSWQSWKDATGNSVEALRYEYRIVRVSLGVKP